MTRALRLLTLLMLMLSLPLNGMAGVDSAVAAVLIHEAIGDQLTCVFVDHGLLRLGEAEQVVALFRDHYNIPLVIFGWIAAMVL